MLLPAPWLRRRWQFLAIYWLAQTVIAYFFSLVLAWAFLSDVIDGWPFWLSPFGLTLAILLLQSLFLVPIRKPAVGAGTPIMVSLGVGGLLIGVLAVALVLAVGHLLQVYDVIDVGRPTVIVLGVLLGTWAVSTPLLIRFCRRGKREAILQRVATGIFLGSIVEAAAMIPLDALIRRREECVCGTGTFLGLALCGSVGIFVFGPAIFLPLVLRHRKRWYGRRCDACGYDMTGQSGAERCPECGAGWRASRVS
ncbi:MAG: hypothetical protein ACYTGP_02740 [Planctomycetota bacterium]|jgi:hypothetical protein